MDRVLAGLARIAYWLSRQPGHVAQAASDRGGLPPPGGTTEFRGESVSVCAANPSSVREFSPVTHSTTQAIVLAPKLDEIM